jgi:hypothetical protein
MSEFQISLLGIGIVVVLSVLIYNAIQRRRFRRRFDAMFRAEREDVLSSPERQAVREKHAGAMAVERVEHILSAEVSDAAAPVLHPVMLDTALLFPDELTDYVVRLSFDRPVSAQVLTLLWQQRFDFGKTVYACGLNAANGTWEKVIPDSLFSYREFKISLQMVDRAGAISEARLEDFRNLARNIADESGARVNLPDVAAASARAKTLDAFCAEVDQLVGLNIVPPGERKLAGGDVANAADLHGMVLQADGSFQLLDEEGVTVFSLVSSDSALFQYHTLAQTWVSGLTLLLDVPCVEHPVRRFEEMAVLARQISMNLHASVVDDNNRPLGELGVTQIREQVAVIAERMRAGDILPGSAQARRLFS